MQHSLGQDSFCVLLIVLDGATCRRNRNLSLCHNDRIISVVLQIQTFFLAHINDALQQALRKSIQPPGAMTARCQYSAISYNEVERESGYIRPKRNGRVRTSPFIIFLFSTSFFPLQFLATETLGDSSSLVLLPTSQLETYCIVLVHSFTSSIHASSTKRLEKLPGTLAKHDDRIKKTTTSDRHFP